MLIYKSLMTSCIFRHFVTTCWDWSPILLSKVVGVILIITIITVRGRDKWIAIVTMQAMGQWYIDS